MFRVTRAYQFRSLFFTLGPGWGSTPSSTRSLNQTQACKGGNLRGACCFLLACLTTAASASSTCLRPQLQNLTSWGRRGKTFTLLFPQVCPRRTAWLAFLFDKIMAIPQPSFAVSARKLAGSSTFHEVGGRWMSKLDQNIRSCVLWLRCP